MKTIEQKKRTGSSRGKIPKDTALKQIDLPPLPDGIPDYPASIMSDSPQYERVRELYSNLAHSLKAYGPIHQTIDCMLMVQVASNYQLWEHCNKIAMDPEQLFIREAKSHCARERIEDPETGEVTYEQPYTLKKHPAYEIRQQAEADFRAGMNALGLTIAKRASILGVLSHVNSIHGNSNTQADPLARFFVANELQTAEDYYANT